MLFGIPKEELQLSEESTYEVSAGKVLSYFETGGAEPAAVVGWYLPGDFDVDQAEEWISSILDELRRITADWEIRSLVYVSGLWRHQFEEETVRICPSASAGGKPIPASSSTSHPPIFPG